MLQILLHYGSSINFILTAFKKSVEGFERKEQFGAMIDDY